MLCLFIVIITFIISYFSVDFDKLSNNNSTQKPIVNNSVSSKPLSYHQAILTGNISSCDNLDNLNLKDSCLLELVECHDDNCYFDKARFKKNESLCFKIEDENKRAGCSADISLSKIIESSVLDDDISLCDSFEDDSSISYCRDNYYIAKRYNENNLDFCNQIKNEVIKNECLK